DTSAPPSPATVNGPGIRSTNHTGGGTAMSDELWRLSAGELATLIRKREVSSREVVDAHLARIEQVNPAVNAVTVTLAESAQAAADQADAEREADANGRLHGVPITGKDNIDLTGSATNQALDALESAMPDPHAPHLVQNN